MKLYNNLQTSSVTDTSTQDETSLSSGSDAEDPAITTLCTPDSQK